MKNFPGPSLLVVGVLLLIYGSIRQLLNGGFDAEFLSSSFTSAD